jgi:hypothetical protein
MFSYSAFASIILTLLAVIALVAYTRMWIATLFFIAWVCIQPFLSSFSINMSDKCVIVRWRYLGIVVRKIKVPFSNFIIEKIPGSYRKNKDYAVVDFLGDFSSESRYIRIQYNGNEYLFSCEMLKGGDNYKFEAELWNMINECYLEIQSAT